MIATITAVASLALLAVFVAIPNYLAIRYALLGDVLSSGGAPAGASAAPAVVKPAAARKAAPGFVQGGYMWKALSPILFAVSLIMGIAVSGPIGIAITTVGLLNLIWGFLGWSGNYVGKRHY